MSRRHAYALEQQSDGIRCHLQQGTRLSTRYLASYRPTSPRGKRNDPGTAGLGLADHQKTVAEVHIFNVEANQFPAAKPT